MSSNLVREAILFLKFVLMLVTYSLPLFPSSFNFAAPHIIFKVARLDFLGGYLPSLSIDYVVMSKDMKTVLYKDEISYDLGFFCNRSRHGNVMTPLRFSFIFVFLCTRSFLKKSLKGVCTRHNYLHYGKV